MLRLIVLSALIFSLFGLALGQKKTILGIFAHPDDENMVGAVLAKYARLGHKVHVIIATDGRDGTKVTKIPAGDELARVRRAETECACSKLGIEKPIYFSIERLDTKIGVRAYLNGRKRFIEKLKEQIIMIKPDVLISFGPDGEYGHSEHIVVGASVEELLLREGWVEKYPLYFAMDTKATAADDPDLGYVAEKYMNAAVTFSEQDGEKYNEAVKCYVSQFTPEEMQESIDHAKNAKKVRYFRRFAASSQRVRKELLP